MTSPAISELQRLLRLGFHRELILTDDGRLDYWIFGRDWQGWREVVIVYSDQAARAYRTEIAMTSDNPLYVPADAAKVLLPRGDVVSIVHALLSLPSPSPQDGGSR